MWATVGQCGYINNADNYFDSSCNFTSSNIYSVYVIMNTLVTCICVYKMFVFHTLSLSKCSIIIKYLDFNIIFTLMINSHSLSMVTYQIAPQKHTTICSNVAAKILKQIQYVKRQILIIGKHLIHTNKRAREYYDLLIDQEKETQISVCELMLQTFDTGSGLRSVYVFCIRVLYTCS